MASERVMAQLAKQTFVAMSNPYGSIEKVFPHSFDVALNLQSPEYVGIKDQQFISESLLLKLYRSGFVLHTIDCMAMGGRAVDQRLTNPITGRLMTGSSSGTAINVRLGINSLGIGTDGGGSVLMPALSLNLFGVISDLIAPKGEPLPEAHYSTDGVLLRPSLGFIARDLGTLIKASSAATGKVLDPLPQLCILSEPNLNVSSDLPVSWMDIGEFPSASATRREQIEFLTRQLKDYDLVIANEGPVDINGMGDSIYGHLGEMARNEQSHSGKYLSRVANMINATAVVIPSTKAGYGVLILGKREHATEVLVAAQHFLVESDPMLTSYFEKLDTYFSIGYGYPHYPTNSNSTQ